MGLQLACLVAVIAITLWRQVGHPSFVIVVGLATFNFVFAMNSSIQSYLILTYTDVESVSLNVGLYSMANAGGRLLGTLLSGWVCLRGGMQPCLWVSALFVGLSWLGRLRLPPLAAVRAIGLPELQAGSKLGLRPVGFGQQ
jgi:predicted MFS family arabinose efflux permease